MTNLEAVDVLKANYPDACYEDLTEAVDMAISTLESQPCTDAVRRGLVKDMLIYNWDECCSAVIRDLEELPPVRLDVIHCSECEHYGKYTKFCFRWGNETTLDGFCHLAGRRKDG